MSDLSPLSGANRTLDFGADRSVDDPKQKFEPCAIRTAIAAIDPKRCSFNCINKYVAAPNHETSWSI